MPRFLKNRVTFLEIIILFQYATIEKRNFLESKRRTKSLISYRVRSLFLKKSEVRTFCPNLVSWTLTAFALNPQGNTPSC